jgi:hypothetical protein
MGAAMIALDAALAGAVLVAFIALVFVVWRPL